MANIRSGETSAVAHVYIAIAARCTFGSARPRLSMAIRMRWKPKNSRTAWTSSVTDTEFASRAQAVAAAYELSSWASSIPSTSPRGINSSGTQIPLANAAAAALATRASMGMTSSNSSPGSEVGSDIANVAVLTLMRPVFRTTQTVGGDSRRSSPMLHHGMDWRAPRTTVALRQTRQDTPGTASWRVLAKDLCEIAGVKFDS